MVHLASSIELLEASRLIAGLFCSYIVYENFSNSSLTERAIQSSIKALEEATWTHQNFKSSNLR